MADTHQGSEHDQRPMPAFLRQGGRADAVNEAAQRTSDRHRQSFLTGMEAFGRVERERDEYRDKYLDICERFRKFQANADVQLASINAHVQQLEMTLATMKAERDHYMLNTTELLTQFTSLQGIIAEGLETARIGVYRPNRGATLRAADVPLTEQDEAALKRIITSLAPPRQEQQA